MKNKIIYFNLGVLLCGAIFIASCAKPPVVPPKPSAPPLTFHNIVVSGLCKVNLVAGSTNAVKSADGAMVQTIINGTLFLSGAGVGEIEVIDVDTLVANGVTSINASTALNLDRVIIVGNGVSTMTLDINADSIEFISNGVGPYTLKGNTQKLHLHSNGAALVSAYNLLSKNCITSILGIGISEVYATEELKAIIAGNGTIYYKGGAAVTKQLIAGVGKVLKK
ncbi:MAG: DUF2807 domain-containing protein [Bacteroidia bacterium]